MAGKQGGKGVQNPRDPAGRWRLLRATGREQRQHNSRLIPAAPTAVKFHRLVLIVLAMMAIIVVSVLH